MKNWKLELTFSVEPHEWFNVKEAKEKAFSNGLSDCKIHPHMTKFDPYIVVHVERDGKNSSGIVWRLAYQFEKIFPGSQLIEVHVCNISDLKVSIVPLKVKTI